MPGVGISPFSDNYVPPSLNKAPISSFGDPSNYSAAASTQAADYDAIMKQYADLAQQYKTNPITATNITPQTVQATTAPYAQSSDVTGSLKNLSDLATTGGYSDANIADIRARDISPIRSIYSNAQRNVDQARTIGGGYSPNFDAVQAQMARDEANQIANTTTAVNAGIAQNVASNKLSAAPNYASAAGSANSTKLAADQANANIVNQINQGNQSADLTAQGANQAANLSAQSQNRGGQLGAVQGQASLYGTTPALTNTFGNQVAQAAQIGQNQQQLDTNRQRMILGA